jgi:hypothetical protein
MTPLAYAGERIDPAAGLVLANRFVRFEFEPGGMGLSAMVDLQSGRNHIGKTESKHLLWEVALGAGTQLQKITNNYKPCNYAVLETLPDGTQRAILEWNDLRWWIEDAVLSVRLTVELPPDSGIARWRMSVDNASDYWGVRSATFPLVGAFPASGEYDIAHPTFARGGRLSPKWTREFNDVYPSGGWTMQFCSLHRGGDSVYLATMDPDARVKVFGIKPGATTGVLHYAENIGVAGSDYPDLYPVEFGVYQGGWLQAALRYRQWAVRQKWCGAGRLSQRHDLPDAIKNTALWIREDWVWNKAEGTPREMNAPLVAAQEFLGVPVGLHWYNWHQTRFDHLYPHFFPAKAGFDERVKNLVERGVLVMPYINGTSADMNIPDFARFAPHAIRDEAGGFRLHFYSDQAGRLLSMCPTQVFWQDAISGVTEDLIRGHGVNGVYVDQISAIDHELCFDPQHGHARGGGRYWADGNRELLGKLLSAARKAGGGAVITSESADEVFLDLVHANLFWMQPMEWEIPLMEVVYSGYAIFFGSPCDYRKSDRYFRFAQGQPFLNGRQNGWMDLGLFQPEHRAKAEFLRECGKLRAAAKKYLLHGDLLGPVEPLNKLPVFTEDFARGPLPQRGIPAAEGRLWKAEDGRLAVILVNYTDRDTVFEYRVEPARHGLAGERFGISELSAQGSRPLGRATRTVERAERLGPAAIKVMEIAPEP